MTPRQRRMTLVFGIIAGVGIAGALALSAFRSNVTFFFDPTAVSEGQVKAGEHFRLGGMVTKGSVKRSPGSLEVRFVVTDFKHDVPVSYTGVLPDLFREGTGVVAHGHMDGKGTFVADEVLAKHDEKYMPPEVAHSLKRRHGEAREEALTEEAPPPATGAGAEAQGQAGKASASEPSPPATTSVRPASEPSPPATTSVRSASEPSPPATTSVRSASDVSSPVSTSVRSTSDPNPPATASIRSQSGPGEIGASSPAGEPPASHAASTDKAAARPPRSTPSDAPSGTNSTLAQVAPAGGH